MRLIALPNWPDAPGVVCTLPGCGSPAALGVKGLSEAQFHLGGLTRSRDDSHRGASGEPATAHVEFSRMIRRSRSRRCRADVPTRRFHASCLPAGQRSKSGETRSGNRRGVTRRVTLACNIAGLGMYVDPSSARPQRASGDRVSCASS